MRLQPYFGAVRHAPGGAGGAHLGPSPSPEGPQDPLRLPGPGPRVLSLAGRTAGFAPAGRGYAGLRDRGPLPGPKDPFDNPLAALVSHSGRIYTRRGSRALLHPLLCRSLGHHPDHAPHPGAASVPVDGCRCRSRCLAGGPGGFGPLSSSPFRRDLSGRAFFYIPFDAPGYLSALAPLRGLPFPLARCLRPALPAARSCNRHGFGMGRLRSLLELGFRIPPFLLLRPDVACLKRASRCRLSL